jgi:hypothetical protein
MDPRVKTPPAGLQQQFMLSKMLYDDIVQANDALREVRGLRAQLTPLKERFQASQAYTQYAAKAEALEAGEPPSLNSLSTALRATLGLLQGADVAPPSQTVAAANELHKVTADLIARWSKMKEDIGPLNKELGTTLKVPMD